LSEQIPDLLIVAARAERFNDFSMIGLLLQLHPSGHGFENCAGYLGSREISQPFVAEFLRLF